MPVSNTSNEYEPKIIAYLCTWCSYTGADTAGIARMKYPANLRAVRVPCSGRVSPEIVMRTFDQGADGVLILGCHIGECHYDSGNHRTAKRFPILRSLMTYAGLEKERIRLDWVSASEGERFSRIVNDFIEEVKPLGPAKWRTKVSDRHMPNHRFEVSDSERLEHLLARLSHPRSPSNSHQKPFTANQKKITKFPATSNLLPGIYLRVEMCQLLLDMRLALEDARDQPS
jgi:F420-non-reducing hydrogenase iron-sulfur subunit